MWTVCIYSCNYLSVALLEPFYACPLHKSTLERLLFCQNACVCRLPFKKVKEANTLAFALGVSELLLYLLVRGDKKK